MRQAKVFCRGVYAGLLSKDDDGKYRYEYSPEYRSDPRCPAISLTLPKQEAPFESQFLFPYFFGLLAEGEDKELQCRILKIDENDHYTRLVRTCGTETIGGVTVREVIAS